MAGLVTYTLVCLGSLFAIVDPFAAVPFFIALTADRSRAEQKRVALRAATTCLVVLLSFALAGALILEFFSVTLSAFKIAGGVILFGVGMEMIRAKPSGTRSTEEEQTEAQSKDDVGLVPLGLPLLSGPGSIATVMVLAGKAKTFPQRASVFVAVVVVAAACFLILRSASWVGQALGKTGINLIGRIMGLILAATAVQFMLDGVSGAFPKL